MVIPCIGHVAKYVIEYKLVKTLTIAQCKQFQFLFLVYFTLFSSEDLKVYSCRYRFRREFPLVRLTLKVICTHAEVLLNMYISIFGLSLLHFGYSLFHLVVDISFTYRRYCLCFVSPAVIMRAADSNSLLLLAFHSGERYSHHTVFFPSL